MSAPRLAQQAGWVARGNYTQTISGTSTGVGFVWNDNRITVGTGSTSNHTHAIIPATHQYTFR